MSESAEVVARAFVNAINRQDVEGLAELMTPEHRFVDSLGGVTEGREKMRAGWVGYFKMVPDYSIVVEECYSHGPVVIMFGMGRGTYCPDDGSHPWSPNARDQGHPSHLRFENPDLGHPELKAENRWETPAAWRAVVEGGLVAEWRVYADNEPMRERMRRAG
jgi:limonene-1,2-epoxide hydrolase